jgi:hypothetical protein
MPIASFHSYLGRFPICFFSPHTYTTYPALEAWSSISNPLKPENQDQISEQQVVLGLFTPWTHQTSAITHCLTQFWYSHVFFYDSKIHHSEFSRVGRRKTTAVRRSLALQATLQPYPMHLQVHSHIVVRPNPLAIMACIVWLIGCI